MPAWVDAGFNEYAQRMPRAARLELIAIKPEARIEGRTVERLIEAEGRRILAALPTDCVKVALDERGTSFSTLELSRRIERWRGSGRDVAFIVGGADGLAEGLKRT